MKPSTASNVNKVIELPGSRSSTAGKKRVVFQIRASPGSDVSVAGNFNGWKPHDRPLKETSGGVFTRTMYLPQGRVEYKFFINGEWAVDPACREQVPNGFGTSNCVLDVR